MAAAPPGVRATPFFCTVIVAPRSYAYAKSLVRPGTHAKFAEVTSVLIGEATTLPNPDGTAWGTDVPVTVPVIVGLTMVLFESDWVPVVVTTGTLATVKALAEIVPAEKLPVASRRTNVLPTVRSD